LDSSPLLEILECIRIAKVAAIDLRNGIQGLLPFEFQMKETWNIGGLYNFNSNGEHIDGYCERTDFANMVLCFRRLLYFVLENKLQSWILDWTSSRIAVGGGLLDWPLGDASKVLQ
jgi:hypothetical protein